MVLQLQPEVNVVPQLPVQVIDAMATRAQRMHHYLWHQVRNFWNTYPANLQQQIKALGWEPPRPAYDKNFIPLLDNDAGEDFLYMHRQMIAFVNNMLAEIRDPNYGRVEGWVHVPAPDNPDFPVPPAWFDPTAADPDPAQDGNKRLQRIKSDIYYEKRFEIWEKMFTDPNFLKSTTLGRFGALIEVTIHNSMHMRWAANPGADRPEPPDPTQAEAIPTDWDTPQYDFLGDTYSSHVNPLFWKIHGWVDDRIEDWKTVNGIFGESFWKGTWVGKMPEGMSMHEMLSHSEAANAHLDTLEQLVKLMARENKMRNPFKSFPVF